MKAHREFESFAKVHFLVGSLEAIIKNSRYYDYPGCCQDVERCKAILAVEGNPFSTPGRSLSGRRLSRSRSEKSSSRNVL